MIPPGLHAVLAILALLPAAPDRDEIIVADFEGETYLPWVAEGEAFGVGPARGALPGQMGVSGFLGRGLVNSFVGGDDSTGTLTSPPIRVERPFLNFLIGGGKYPGENCLDLVVDGATVRTATGPNDRPGGSERLDWASWDVSALVGKEAVLRVVDRRTGGWGHITVDQIVQSDRPRGVVPAAFDLAADARYLHLPIREDAPIRRVRVAVDGTVAREFDIKLAAGQPAYSAFLDLSPFASKRLRIEADLPAGSGALGEISRSNEVPDAGGLYREAGRPQFHFTSRRGWLNDPNGLVWHDGEYHLFYQHNPYGWDWGNMHWGHAVSKDLVRWAELPIALYPRRYDDWCFSGSAVVDDANTSGFGEGGAPMVLAYTSTGRGECIAFSRDRGRTWSEYPGNPVIRHQGRDPRLLRLPASGKWAMAVYDEGGGGKAIAFYSSPDLKAWTYESKIDGFYECPDLFELPVEGEPGRSLWVLSGADGEYILGRFDGRTFAPEPGRHRTWHGDFYAAQTFSNEPNGRRVQIGWARGIAFPGMPFNQQMTVPCELTLRPTGDGVRMFARPVVELDGLRSGGKAWRDLDLGPEARPLDGAEGDLLDIRIAAEVGTAGKFTLRIPGAAITYDAGRRTIACAGFTAPLSPSGGTVTLRILADRRSVEVFGDNGRVALSGARARTQGGRPEPPTIEGEGVRIRSIEVDKLGSTWK